MANVNQFQSFSKKRSPDANYSRPKKLVLSKSPYKSQVPIFFSF